MLKNRQAVMIKSLQLRRLQQNHILTWQLDVEGFCK